jgi:3-methyl-2-oxobutanoate hydroxymethyltransferase
MPYLSFHLSVEDTLRNAGGFLQRGAAGVKLEGGAKRLAMVHALIDAEIPVMGHLGLTPQSLNVMGGYKVQGRAKADALRILEDAHRLQEAGCFCVLLEGIPADLAARVTETLSIPTLGIGAGPHCTGQVLVFHDILGLTPEPGPKFVRRYAQGFQDLRAALATWAEDVRTGAFPDARESYTLPEAVRPALDQWKP